MSLVGQGFAEAARLLLTADRAVLDAVGVSLQVSAAAIAIASLVAVPVAYVAAQRPFLGRDLLVAILHALMAVPTVVVGLFVYSFLSRAGVLGFLGLLYSRPAMIVGQVLLAIPIVASLAHAAFATADPRIVMTARGLGATEAQAAWALVRETRFALGAAIGAGFGRVIGEVGAALMLGGNIAGATRTMTTAIALETSKGELGTAFALGVILLTVAIAVHIMVYILQRK